MSDRTPLSSEKLTREQLADIRLEDSEHETARLVVKKPHPRDYGAIIFESRNGPLWSIGTQYECLRYHRDSAAYWRAKYEGLVNE